MVEQHTNEQDSEHSPLQDSPHSPLSRTLAASPSYGASAPSTRGSSRISSPGATARKQRKRNTNDEDELTLTDYIDHQAEESMKTFIEDPVWLEPFKSHPTCQRLCFPADHATRSTRQIDISLLDDEQSFGFPEFDRAGFTILENHETEWHDRYVPDKIGLQVAIHRKSCVRRLCHMLRKSLMPRGVGSEQVRTLVRCLRRNDHVNCVACTEVLEDSDHIYFIYEDHPCITLQYAIEMNLPFSQEQIVNIVRECAAAVAFASSFGLSHLGLTLCHVLLPATALHGDMLVAKVFGFGLMGVMHCDSWDRLCWSPEALDKFTQAPSGTNWVTRLESKNRMPSDSWSLGVIIFTLIGKCRPFCTEKQVMQKKYTLVTAFDTIDPEARTLVEGLLYSNTRERMDACRILHHEWIRRRWRAPSGTLEVFESVHEFCRDTLARRLFNRFLVRFLEAFHWRKIAIAYYTLDCEGRGVITQKELQNQARLFGKPSNWADSITEWFCGIGGSVKHISLNRFAECMADNVADGPALRVAFENLDQDGSEQVSAVELWQALRTLDRNISLRDVQAHITSVDLMLDPEAAESKPTPGDQGDLQQQGEGATDNADRNIECTIDYSEFVQLFPVREVAAKWIKDLNAAQANIVTLTEKTSSAISAEDADKSAQDIRKFAHRANELICDPPYGGSTDASAVPWKRVSSRATRVTGASPSTARAKLGKDQKAVGWSVDTFLLEQATREKWSTLLSGDVKNLKVALTRGKLVKTIDVSKAHDIARLMSEKIAGVIAWSTPMLEDCISCVDACVSQEETLPRLQVTSRAVQLRWEDIMEDGRDEEFEAEAEENPCASMSRMAATAMPI
eukprot:TRINITY_DN18443_c0_g1_i3.p1 TRINITY_DN18443_c0_g1~~TRINITY_DN18443_c0_g1_i3.p1  ORF type:complete len:899 (+),score=141.49 TRINITY_DN18443_c0_g1_i3:149-2698(+)